MDTQGNERSMSEPCEGDMTIPTPPSANLILAQPTFAGGCFKADLDLPLAARNIGPRLPCGHQTQGIDHVLYTFMLFIEAAPRPRVLSEAKLLGQGYATDPSTLTGQRSRLRWIAPRSLRQCAFGVLRGQQSQEIRHTLQRAFAVLVKAAEMHG